MNDSDKLQNNDNLLERELSLGGEISPAGLKGNAKLRWNSADKGLFGTAGDFIRGGMARYNARKNAENENTVALIKAQGKTELRDMESKQKLAGLTNEGAVLFELIQKSKLNEEVKNLKKKIIMLEAAQEELQRQPPKDEEAETGSVELSEGFLNRIQEKLKTATEEEVRKKWAKVFAAEIRKPRGFSARVMRIIEEIDDKTAELFREICQHRIGTVTPKCFLRDAEYIEQNLTGEGLLIEQFKGVIFTPEQAIKDDRRNIINLSIAELNKRILAIPRNVPVKSELIPAIQAREPVAVNYIDDGRILNREPDKIIPAFKLSSDGMALASISPDNTEKNFQAYIQMLSAFLPPSILLSSRERSVLIGEKLPDGRSQFFRDY